MERKVCPSPMSEQEMLDFSKAAESAAKKVIGEGTAVHSPESVASDKVCQQIAKTSRPRNVSSLGGKAGKNGAIDCLRRKYVEIMHLEFIKCNVEEKFAVDTSAAVEHAEECTSLREAMFAMKPSEFVYPLFCDALDFPMTLVAKAINHAIRRELTRAAHASRGKLAKQRLRATLEKSKLAK